MAYKDILPQTNLDAVDIRDTIGCPSNNLADYCVKAKTGGIGGYAFKIAENGHLPSDGYLIEGASPYFNIWSNNSPGEWVAPKGGTSYVKYRLRRNKYGTITVGNNYFDSTSYCFDLGAYRGYTHISNGPTLARQGDPPLRDEDAPEEGVNIYISLGDVDWITTVYQTPNVDRTKFYIEIATVSGGSFSFSTGKVKYDDVGQYLALYSVPIITSMAFNIVMYEFDGSQYNIVAILPIEKIGQFNMFDFSITVPLFRINYLPKVEQLRLDNISTSIEDVFDFYQNLTYNSLYDYWGFSIEITYRMPSAHLNTSMVTEFTFINQGQFNPQGNIQYYSIDLISSDGDYKTSLIEGRLPKGIGVGKSEDAQLYTFIMKYQYS